MTADAGLPRAFGHYLRRVLGDAERRIVISEDVSIDEPGDAWIAVIIGNDLHMAASRLPNCLLSRRFANWDALLPPMSGVEPVSIFDRWDPGAVSETPESFDVLALVTTFNESDIVEQLVHRLFEDRIRIHVIDNWSTDDTYELLQQFERSGMISLERFPREGPSGFFELQPLLQRVEDLAHRSGADWVIHHDADEIRESPWPGISLRNALFAIESWGFNCIDHTVINFRPVADTWQPGDDLAASFQWFEFGEGPALFQQFKAWKPQPTQVVMAASGGHDAAFPSRRVFPYKFLTRHYPIRSQTHGERKILRERQSRWSTAERARGWHTHYDHFGPESCFIWDPSELIAWSDLDRAYLLQRLSGVGLPGNPWEGESLQSEQEAVPFDESAYRAAIQLTDRSGKEIGALDAFRPGEIRPLSAAVQNGGSQIWLRQGRNSIGLASKWFAGDEPDLNGPPIAEGARSLFPADVQPGSRLVQPVTVQAPPEPGTYTLLIDLVHEQVRWFGCGTALTIEVTSPIG